MRDPAAPDRRLDLDWLRIGAFGLLILYHCSTAFVAWHVTSEHHLAWMPRAMQVLNPWRLALLFVISGCVTAMMAERMPRGALARQRLARLGLPLLAGMALVVPPQSWWELRFKAGYGDDLLHFWLHDYFSFGQRFCAPGPCITLPTWNHLWFVAYLLVYTLLAAAVPAAVWRWLRAGMARLGLGVLVLPWALLFAARQWLYPVFRESHALVGDWYAHALYGGVFLFGWLAAGTPEVWAALRRWRWLALAVAVLAWPAFQWLEAPVMTAAERTWFRLFYTLYQWHVIAALLGFAQGWKLHDSAARRYLTEAVFPFYIIHQTVAVGLVFALRGAGYGAAAEAAIVIGITALACVVFYEVVRRSGPLRPWFGLKPP